MSCTGVEFWTYLQWFNILFAQWPSSQGPQQVVSVQTSQSQSGYNPKAAKPCPIFYNSSIHRHLWPRSKEEFLNYGTLDLKSATGSLIAGNFTHFCAEPLRKQWQTEECKIVWQITQPTTFGLTRWPITRTCRNLHLSLSCYPSWVSLPISSPYHHICGYCIQASLMSLIIIIIIS